MPIFRVKSVKIYTGQKKFTRAPLVVLVTNMRYGDILQLKIGVGPKKLLGLSLHKYLCSPTVHDRKEKSPRNHFSLRSRHGGEEWGKFYLIATRI